MTSIVALTDFSTTADNALRYAAALAQRTGAALTILHVYQIPVTMNDMPVILISAEELKNNVDERLAKTKEELARLDTGINIRTEGLIGDVADEVRPWVESNGGDVIIAGTHESSGAERMLLGSTSAAVVRHLRQPVIAVPQTYTDFHFEKIVLATDLSHHESFPAMPIINIVQTLGAQLKVVHVSQDSANRSFSIPELESLQPQYQVIYNEDVNRCLQDLQKEADLLIVLPHEHNIIERLFFRLHTEPLLNHAYKPILAIRN